MAEEINKTCKVRYRVVLYRFNFDIFKELQKPVKSSELILNKTQEENQLELILKGQQDLLKNLQQLQELKELQELEQFFFLDPVSVKYKIDLNEEFKKKIVYFYKALYKAYKKDPQNFVNRSVVEYDITPLVTNINVVNRLEGVNNCSISCSNILYGNLTENDLLNFRLQNKWWEIINNENLQTYLRKINSLIFREYDFIRVYVIGDNRDFEKDITDFYGKIYKSNEEYNKELNLLKNNLEIQLRPIFTGVVKSIVTRQAVDTVFSIDLNCSGIFDVFGQTSIVADQAIYNAVTIGEENRPVTTWADIENNPITPAANLFQGKLAPQVFVEIIDRFLKPYKKEISKEFKEKLEKEQKFKFTLTEEEKKKIESGEIPDFVLLTSYQPYYLGLPNPHGLIKSLYVNFDKLESGGDNIDNLTLDNIYFVPFFFVLFIYHVIKYKKMERIFYIPDLDDDLYSNGGLSLTHITEYLLYLLMFKDQFSLYDASYTTPLSIFNDLRKNVFFDIYEDGSGCIILQIPRCAIKEQLYSRVNFSISDVNSTEINISDSANSNAIGVYQSIDLIGALSVIPAKYYVDQLSAFRFGLRVANPISNPNVRNNPSAENFSKFYRFYYLHKYSRTASINIIGIKDIRIGENLWFKVHNFSSAMQREDVFVDTSAYGVQDYWGYVESVTYNISVDSVPTQNVLLTFLRSNVQVKPSKRCVPKLGIWDYIESQGKISTMVAGFYPWYIYTVPVNREVYELSNVFDVYFYHPSREPIINSQIDDIVKNKVNNVVLSKNLIMLKYIQYKENQKMIDILSEVIEKINDNFKNVTDCAKYHSVLYNILLNSSSEGLRNELSISVNWFFIKSSKEVNLSQDEVINELSKIGQFPKEDFNYYFPNINVKTINKEINNDLKNVINITLYKTLAWVLVNREISSLFLDNDQSVVGKDYEYVFSDYLGCKYELYTWEKFIKYKYPNKDADSIKYMLSGLVESWKAAMESKKIEIKKENDELEEEIKAYCEDIRKTNQELKIKKEKEEERKKMLEFITKHGIVIKWLEK